MNTNLTKKSVSSIGKCLQQLRWNRYVEGKPISDDVTSMIEIVYAAGKGFPIDEITDVTDGENDCLQLRLNRLLTGAGGSLPLHWKEMIDTARGEGGDVLRAIVVIFETVLLQLEDASELGLQPWKTREWNAQSGDNFDAIAGVVLQMLGSELQEAARECGVELLVLIQNAKLFLLPPSREGLELFLQKTMKLPIRVLTRPSLNRPRARIRVGPVDSKVLSQWHPNQETVKRLLKLARLYSGDQLTLDVEILVSSESVDSITFANQVPGWNCWAVTPGIQQTARTRIPAWRCRKMRGVS